MQTIIENNGGAHNIYVILDDGTKMLMDDYVAMQAAEEPKSDEQESS